MKKIIAILMSLILICSQGIVFADVISDLQAAKVLPENVTYNSNIAYYANGHINIVGSVDHIEIYNTNGQLVNKQDVTSGNNVIPTNLRQGVYIVKIYNNKLISTNKIIIK